MYNILIMKNVIYRDLVYVSNATSLIWLIQFTTKDIEYVNTHS